MTAELAETLRQLRAERGLSLRQLAKDAHCGKSYIQELETGLKPATPTVACSLDEALGAAGRLSRLVAGAAPPAPTETPVEVAALADAEPMGERDVQLLHETVAHLVALDTMHGSEGLYSNASRAFRNAQRRLAKVGVRPGARSDLYAALAEVGEVGAWLAYDSEHHDVSREIATDALLVAHQAGDTSMVRFLMSHMSMQAVYLGRGSEALELSDRVLAERPRSVRVVGMMRARRARALGCLGDTTDALRELAKARTDLSNGVGPDDPGWTWWLHAAELSVHEARIKAAGGDTRGAIAAGERSIIHLPPGQGRDHALFRAWLMSDLVDVGAWREVDEMAGQVMERASIVGSARVPRIIKLAERRAGRAGAPGWVTDALREAADAANPAA